MLLKVFETVVQHVMGYIVYLKKTLVGQMLYWGSEAHIHQVR